MMTADARPYLIYMYFLISRGLESSPFRLNLRFRSRKLFNFLVLCMFKTSSKTSEVWLGIPETENISEKMFRIHVMKSNCLSKV